MSSTEAPRLTWFELEVCPLQLRLAVATGQNALFGYQPEDGSKVRSYAMRYRRNEEHFKSLLESLHWLLVANAILDTPQTAPDKAFDVQAMSVKSVHLRIAYSDGRKWASVYTEGEAPANVLTLIDQARYLGVREFEAPAEPKPAEAE
jgi:hypothetical protein